MPAPCCCAGSSSVCLFLTKWGLLHRSHPSRRQPDSSPSALSPSPWAMKTSTTTTKLRHDPLMALFSEKSWGDSAPLAGKSTLNRLELAPSEGPDTTRSTMTPRRVGGTVLPSPPPTSRLHHPRSRRQTIPSTASWTFADRTSTHTFRANQLRLSLCAYVLMEGLRRDGCLARATVGSKLLKIGAQHHLGPSHQGGHGFRLSLPAGVSSGLGSTPSVRRNRPNRHSLSLQTRPPTGGSSVAVARKNAQSSGIRALLLAFPSNADKPSLKRLDGPSHRSSANPGEKCLTGFHGLTPTATCGRCIPAYSTPRAGARGCSF